MDHLSPNQRAWQRFTKNKPAWYSLWFVVVLCTVVMIWPLFSRPAFANVLPQGLTHSAIAVSDLQFDSPSLKHWFGTDIHGRDLLSRVMSGARISILVGIVGAMVSLVIGVLWGAIAGYVGGWWDGAMMRFVDILYALPSIVFVIVLITSLSAMLQDNLNPQVKLKDFRDADAFYLLLKNDQSAAVNTIRAKFPEAFRQQIQAYQAGQATPRSSSGFKLEEEIRIAEQASIQADALQKSLAAELNNLVGGPLLVDVSLSHFSLRTKSVELAAKKPEGAELTRLNRFLLEDVFPEQLKKRETWFTRSVAFIFPPQKAGMIRMVLLFVGLGAVSWLTMARIVRGQVLSLKNRQFVDASRSLGASSARILFQHILPNVLGIIIVYITLTVPSVILYESFLSYLGLGIQPPFASWGSLISEGAGQLNPVRIYWWLIIFPAVTLVTTLLALNFFGDGLRDAFDPRG